MSQVIRTAKGPVPRQLRPWLPGESPRGGRAISKKPRSVAKAIRELLSHDPGRLIQLLLEIAEDQHARDSDRIKACAELLDRGYGKAPEFVPIKDGDPLEMGQLEQAIQEILARKVETTYTEVEAETSAEPEQPVVDSR